MTDSKLQDGCMEEKVFRYIIENSLLENGDTVLIALSGGSDSVALFSVMLKLREKLGLTVFAAHVNHNLRGKDSEGDEFFVKNLCKKYNVPLFVKSVDINKISKEKSIGTEQCAREERYKFFDDVCIENHIKKIATAHNKNDNAETVIFNLCRGSGLAGLCGIPCKRDNIIRPILCVEKKEILEYLKKENLEYVTDKTNFETEYTRNKIRLKISPVLSEVNEAFVNNIFRGCQSIKQDEEFLTKLAKKSLNSILKDEKLELEGLKKLPLSILNRVIIIFCREKFNVILNSVDIDCIKNMIYNGRTSMKLDLSGGLKCRRTYDYIVFYLENNKNIKKDFYYKLESPVFIEEVSKVVSVKKIKIDNINKIVMKNLYDCDKICGMLIARNRKSGDYFTLSMKKSLKKLFIDKKIPKEERDSIIVICDDNKVVFVEGFGVSKEYRVDKNTLNAGYIEIKKGY